MSTRRQFKYLRYFLNHYQCDACPCEFSETLPVVCFAYCPNCDERIEPYGSEALLEDADDEENAR